MTKRKIAFEKLNSINDFIMAPTNLLKVVKDAYKKSREVLKAAKLRNENIRIFILPSTQPISKILVYIHG